MLDWAALERRFDPAARLYPSRQLKVVGAMVHLEARCRELGLDPRAALAAYGDAVAWVRRHGRVHRDFRPYVEAITGRNATWFWTLAETTVPDRDVALTPEEELAGDRDRAEHWVEERYAAAGIMRGESAATDAEADALAADFLAMFADERRLFGRPLLPAEREHLHRRVGFDRGSSCDCIGCTASTEGWEVA